MKTRILLFFLCLSMPLCFGQIESGIKVSVGMGWLHKELIYKKQPVSFNGSFRNGLSPNPNFDMGYQFRFHHKDRLFFDTGLNYRIRLTNISDASDQQLSEETNLFIFTEGTETFHGLSIHAVQNLKVYKGLSVGAGIEPTLYINTGHVARNSRQHVFDIPILGKVGYDFKKFELALTYKHGFVSLFKNDQVTNGKSREIGISLFLSLFK